MTSGNIAGFLTRGVADRQGLFGRQRRFPLARRCRALQPCMLLRSGAHTTSIGQAVSPPSQFASAPISLAKAIHVADPGR
jgi:hypothetical protein